MSILTLLLTFLSSIICLAEPSLAKNQLLPLIPYFSLNMIELNCRVCEYIHQLVNLLLKDAHLHLPLDILESVSSKEMVSYLEVDPSSMESIFSVLTLTKIDSHGKDSSHEASRKEACQNPKHLSWGHI